MRQGKPGWRQKRPRTLLLLTLLGASMTLGAAQIPLPIPMPGHGRTAAIHKEIASLEQKWHTALLAGDDADMASLLGESYVAIGPDGTMETKSEELQARAAGQQKITRLDVLDRKIRVYGTTAVVVSKVSVQGLYSGEVMRGEYRYTRVWSLAHGQWHIVSFEANQVNDANGLRK